MLREIDENLIGAGKLLKSSDMAKLGCGDCKGCSECCRDRAEPITLDAYDVKLLKEGLDCSFNDLQHDGKVKLKAVDGVVLPTLALKEDRDECVFLGENGRCTIHDFRPGICRMFPLARIYHEDGSFSYFIQEGECSRSNGVKIKIAKWLGYPNIKEYESSVEEYHKKLSELRQQCSEIKNSLECSALCRKFILENFIKG